MVTVTRIRVDGTKAVNDALLELGVQASTRIARSALNRSATPVVKRAKELAPFRTGELRRHISKRVLRQSKRGDRVVVIIGVEKPESPLAHLLEFGTAHSPAQPFLRPALDETAHTALEIQRQAMAEGVEREVRKLAVRALVKAGFRA